MREYILRQPAWSRVLANSLREIQKQIAEAITLGRGTNKAISLIAEGQKTISPKERFDVYADAWFLRLEESLKDDFAALRFYLDEELWIKTLRSYLRTHPSRSYTIARLGDSLPEFLRSQGFKNWQVELAQFELDLCRSLTAADPKLFDISSLQLMNDTEIESLSLKLQPATFIHKFEFDVVSLFEQSQNEFASEESPSISKNEVVIYRNNWNATFEKISDHNEFQFLTALTNPRSLGELADLFTDSSTDQSPSEEWIAWLTKWSQRGAIGPA